ncbi:MAG TPA: hypothetical protein VGM41_14745 [Chitinophagaceae bacterium]|jgi:hypothetical protein
MLSEHTSIDEFIRKKEEEFTLPGSHEDAHWQQMKTMLSAPGKTTPGKTRRQIIRRRIIGYTGGFITITVITTVILLSRGSHNSKKAGTAIAKTAVHNDIHKPTASIMRPPGQPPVHAVAKPVVAATTVAQKIPSGTASAPRATYTRQVRSDTVTTVIPVNSSPDAAVILSRFYSDLQQEPQEFTIHTNIDTTLVGKQGTRIFIPSHVFVSKTGRSVTGPVKIILEEFYSYDKMIAAGLSTMSNGRQLVSGGMLHIIAMADGHELLLKPAMNIMVKMPTNNYDGRMQLFTGNPPPAGSIITKPFVDAASVSHHVEDTGASSPVRIAGDQQIDWMTVGQMQQGFQRPTIRVKDFRNLPASISGDESAAVFYIHHLPGNDKEQIKQELKKRYGYYYDQIKVKYVSRLLQPVLFRSNLTGDSIDLKFDEAIKSKLVSPIDSMAYISRVITDSMAFFSTSGRLKEYTFNISNLGWINCDRFENDPRPRVDFVVDPGPGINTSLLRSQLVFTRYQSLAQGYYHNNKLSYGKIPVGEKIQLVCLCVKNGKMVSCIRSITVSAHEINDLRFEETTPEQFKAKLIALNLSSQ